MTSNAQYSWNEVSPSHWERDIDEAEQFYTSMARMFERTGHTHFAITASFGISLPISNSTSPEILHEKVVQAFQQAWIHCRYDYPNLAAPVAYDPITKKCQKKCHVPEPGDIERWLDESFKLINTGQSGSEFANSDPQFSGPTIFFITPPTQNPGTLRRDIVFRSPHDIVDGIGSLLLINNLLTHTSSYFQTSTVFNLPFTNEDTNSKLSPTLREAASIPPTPTPTQLTNFTTTQHQNASLFTHPSLMTAEYKNPTSSPLRSRRLAIHLTPQETTTILAHCKTQHLTPTHLFHAAISLQLRDTQPKNLTPREGRYISYSLINLRPFCTPPYSTATHAVSVYHCISSTLLSIDLPIPTPSTPPLTSEQKTHEFAQTLEKVKDFYSTTRPTSDYIAITPLIFLSKTPSPPYPTSPPSLPEPNTKPSVSLSSFGLLEKFIKHTYGEFEIEEPWGVGAEYSTGLGLFLGTWKGRMELGVSFNETYHEDGEVVRFLDGCRGWVLEGLGM